MEHQQTRYLIEFQARVAYIHSMKNFIRHPIPTLIVLAASTLFLLGMLGMFNGYLQLLERQLTCIMGYPSVWNETGDIFFVTSCGGPGLGPSMFFMSTLITTIALGVLSLSSHFKKKKKLRNISLILALVVVAIYMTLMEMLHQEAFVDLMCPAVNLFTYASVLCERPPTPK